MAARATEKGFPNALIVYPVVKSGTTTARGVGVKWDTGQADNAGAGDNAFGIALEAVVGDGLLTCKVALLTSGSCIIPVKVGTSGTATQGSYAEAGTAGFTNRTLGGGTTVRYIAGKWHESGVDGDLCGLEIGAFAGVSS